MDVLDESMEFALSLVMMGIAIARNGDSKRVTDHVLPEMLMGKLARKGLQSVGCRDREGLQEFLSSIGVTMIDGEMATDAILRTFIDLHEARVHAHQVVLQRMRAAERKIMDDRTAKAGSAITEVVA